MTNLKLISALALIVALGGALAATAQDAGGSTGPGAGPGMGMGMGGMADGMGPGGPGMVAGLLWSQADTNGDGQVTAEEIEVAVRARFASADADADGFLSPAEFAAAMEAQEEAIRAQRRAEMAERMVDRRDDNGDGKLSADEMRLPRIGESFVERFDADGDGVVSRAEFDAGTQRWMKRHGRDRGHGRDGHRRGRG